MPGSGEPVRIGLLGCGNVGAGVLRLLHEHAGQLAGRVGAQLAVRRVLVRDLSKSRPSECDRSLLTDQAADVLDDPSIDLVVEVMGGEDNTLGLLERAIAAGKGVVTANKLLVAMHGPELLSTAVRNHADLAFEGAVGGGIPIVRTLREAFAGDRVTALSGIVNGTCNYVLSRMLDDDLSMGAAVERAQALGYAEADPSLDIDGHDAAHKLAILALLGFGSPVKGDAVAVEGIRAIEPVDHRFAARFGYRIKHLAIGRDHGKDIELRVHPALIGERTVLANVSGVLNAVLLEGRAVGPCLLYGRGAGGLPTAVSVVSDILDVARSIVAGVSGLQTRGIAQRVRSLRPMGEVVTRYYFRFSVVDQPGVVARLAGRLGEAGVSIEQMVQEAHGGQTVADDAEPPAEGATIVMLTHRAREALVQEALAELGNEAFMLRSPRILRIEDL